MIDLHSHLLHGLDDGPEAVEGSLAIARAAVAAGVRTMVATPHVSRRYPNRSAEIEGHAQQLRERLRDEHIALDVLTGAEVAPSHLPAIDPAELSRLRLGDGPWLLLECPLHVDAPPLQPAVESLQSLGLRVLLAHPERSPQFQHDPDSLAALVRAGAVTSLTAGALTGRFGRTVRRFSLELVRAGVAHCVASDCHDRYHRPPGMAQALGDAGLKGLADWLTIEVPGAILAGAELPPRPAAVGAVRRLDPKAWWRSRGGTAPSGAETTTSG
jgi:protein-tyrosine phosphatase